VGGYSDWLRQRPAPRVIAPVRSAPAVESPVPSPKRKLSYKEQRELESLPGEIEKLETEQRQLTQKMCAADYHRIAPDEMRRDGERTAELDALIAERMERWVLLEEKT
jgi:ABC transport system ATP-binding/permease protein